MTSAFGGIVAHVSSTSDTSESVFVIEKLLRTTKQAK